MLSYGIIKGHPFIDGNKRTGTLMHVSFQDWLNKQCLAGFFLANEYLRAMGIPGLADEGKLGDVYEQVVNIAQRHMDVAAGKLEVEGLSGYSS
jgi:Fic/DOC family